MGFSVLLYYQFASVEDPQAFAERQRLLCQELGLLGRVLVGTEGINGTLSGPNDACDAYMTALRAEPGFADMQFKIDAVEGHVFKKLFVRVRPEIITLGEPAPHDLFGHYMTPAEWKTAMKDPDVLILDGRNDYESAMGHFEGAVCPPVENFREFTGWIRDNLSAEKDRKILTYCTGGVRCEKLVAWMRHEGFENVWQLHGGIVTYGKDPEARGEGFHGVCTVFDDRIAVPINQAEDQPMTQCVHCGEPSVRYINCRNVECNRLMACCETCEADSEGSCSPECRTADFRREPGAKLAKAKGQRRRAAPREFLLPQAGVS